MPNNQISSLTFSNRLFNCSYYKEENTYAYNIRVLFNRIIKTYAQDKSQESIYKLLAEFYKVKKDIYVTDNDKIEYQKKIITCANNLSNFIEKYEPTNLMDEFLFRGRVKGYMGGQFVLNNNTYNLDFSIDSSDMTFHNLYYYRFNSFMYNTVKGIKNDLLVYVISNDHYYLLKDTDYTIGRGTLSTTIKRRTYRPGYHCLTCSVKQCKPRLVTNLERI